MRIFVVMVDKMNLFRQRKGKIFDLTLVFVTLFFSGAVIVAYFSSVDDLSTNLVSPVPVLEMSDVAILFEREEYELLVDSYCDAENADMVRLSFCSGLDDLKYSSFLTQNSVPSSEDINLDNFCDSVYSFEGGLDELVVERKGLLKKKVLKPDSEGASIQFAVFFEYDLERKYLLTSNDC